MAAIECRVRQAVIQDADVLSEHNIAMAKETEGLDLDPGTIGNGVRALLEDPAKGVYYVLQVGEEIAGQLMITYEWSDWRCANAWWIQSVYVKPQHRRRGYFKQLYQHARNEAAAAGACGLRLYAENSNAKAGATYVAMGMVSHYKVYEDMFTAY